MLAGVDSVAVMGICNSLRLASPGLSLRAQDVFKCSDVGELLGFVESQGKLAASKEDAKPSACKTKEDEGKPCAVWFATGQYHATCKWLYGSRGSMDEDCFRIAAARLIERHEALRAEFVDGELTGMDLLGYLKNAACVQKAFWPAAMKGLAELRIPSAAKKAVTGIARAAMKTSAWALKGSWPKARARRITQQFLDERVHVVYCCSWAEVEEASNWLRRKFQVGVGPPVHIGLFILDDWSYRPPPEMQTQTSVESHSWGSPTSFVQFVCSHAFTDGYSGVPLIQDFSTFYSEALTKKKGIRNGKTQSQMVPLPLGEAFKTLEERFFASLDIQPEWSHPAQMSLRACCFDGPWEVNKKWTPWVYTHEVALEAGAVAVLRSCAQRYGLPVDVVLLSLVCAATFRAQDGHELDKGRRDGRSRRYDADAPKTRSLPLTLYAPCRDGDLNDAMIGLFSDWRDISVPCAPNATVLGMCLEMADTLRHRRWQVFDPIQNSERMLVNILPMDEQTRGGALGFRQTRYHEYGSRLHNLPGERRARRYHCRPARITLEQESMDVWWIVMDLNADHFSTGWCRWFVKEIKQMMLELHDRPFSPILWNGVSFSEVEPATEASAAEQKEEGASSANVTMLDAEATEVPPKNEAGVQQEGDVPMDVVAEKSPAEADATVVSSKTVEEVKAGSTLAEGEKPHLDDELGLD
eukprot:TRINITY_DN36247_c0_g1_i1.p1 TRINITY_DN36247_c0_g1~~TRINITY_DN36247_c0_g1_i1.p1  ORF type:complete len:696 (+),score=122.33 TRINITY_DN36247_c0_g1_i1:287-2374(+)